MNSYVTGITIKTLREKRGLTQTAPGNQLGVSNKTVSKWETVKGLTDISLLQPLAAALGVSVIELMNGEYIINQNIASNMARTKFYICPVCGNMIHSIGNTDDMERTVINTGCFKRTFNAQKSKKSCVI